MVIETTCKFCGKDFTFDGSKADCWEDVEPHLMFEVIVTKYGEDCPHCDEYNIVKVY